MDEIKCKFRGDRCAATDLKVVQNFFPKEGLNHKDRLEIRQYSSSHRS